MNTDYASVKSSAFALGSVNNGYFGGRTECLFALVGNHVVAVHDGGYACFGNAKPVVDRSEALFYLERGWFRGGERITERF
jgi:hypothetical protein